MMTAAEITVGHGTTKATFAVSALVAAVVTLGGWLVHYGHVASDSAHHEKEQDRQITANAESIKKLRVQIKDLGILVLEQGADTRALLLASLQASGVSGQFAKPASLVDAERAVKRH